MNRKRTVFAIVFIIFLLLTLLAGTGVYLYLEKDALLELVVEKGITDTTEEKEMNISETFQVYKNRLYCNSEEGFGFTDLETGKRENMTKEFIDDFVICDELIYYLDTSKAFWHVVCKNLNDVAKKERLRVLKNIESYIFVNKEVIALRERDDKHVIIKWGQDGSEQILLEFGFDVIEQYEGQLCGYYEGKYIVFSDGLMGSIYTVDESTGEVRKVFSFEKEGSIGYELRGLKFVKNKVYIWGIAYDYSAQPFLFGECYIEDSEMTGVWQMNLDNYEAERISNEYYREIYMLQGELYGEEETIFEKKELKYVNITKS